MKRKILVVGSHAGSNLEGYVVTALKNMGHFTSFFGYRDRLGRFAGPLRIGATRSNRLRSFVGCIALRKINAGLQKKVEKMMPDVIVVIKGEGVLSATADYIRDELGCKTALWYPDDPRFFETFAAHVAPHYDYFFTASAKALPRYKGIGVENVYHLPFGFEPSIHRKTELSISQRRDLESDVCFVGTCYARRRRLMNRLKGFNVVTYGAYWRLFRWRGRVGGPVSAEEMAKLFSAAKVVLNIHDTDDLGYKPNMRVFEVTGCGAFLLTDNSSGLEKLYEPGEELVCYDNESELVELVTHYVGAHEERINVARKGSERAHREHTYESRMNSLLRYVGS